MKNIGNRLDPPVGMPRETFQVVSRVIGMKIIQEKKRVQHRNVLVAEGSLQVNAGALDGRLAFENLLDFPESFHVFLPVVKGLIIATTSSPKSLLTSLCQREGIPLFEKEG
jgi:hypothetical protein